MRKLVLSIWILVASCVIIYTGYEYYRYYQYKQIVPMAIKLAVEADNSVEWELIGKMLVLILCTYGGIKIINKKI